MTKLKGALLAFMPIYLAACGGGGSSTDTPAAFNSTASSNTEHSNIVRSGPSASLANPNGGEANFQDTETLSEFISRAIHVGSDVDFALAGSGVVLNANTGNSGKRTIDGTLQITTGLGEMVDNNDNFKIDSDVVFVAEYGALFAASEDPNAVFDTGFYHTGLNTRNLPCNGTANYSGMHKLVTGLRDSNGNITTDGSTDKFSAVANFNTGQMRITTGNNNRVVLDNSQQSVQVQYDDVNFNSSLFDLTGAVKANGLASEIVIKGSGGFYGPNANEVQGSASGVESDGTTAIAVQTGFSSQ